MKCDELTSRMREKMRLENKALDTINAYTSVTSRFFAYLVRHSEIREMDHTRRMEAYLTWRVLHHNISPSTQNVEFNALLYLGRKILCVEIGEVNAMRAQPRRRIPHIISSSQVAQFLDSVPSEYSLIVKLLYGAGLRINECLSLRIKDIDLSNGKLIVHEGKGDKDGIVPIPSSLIAELHGQVGRAQVIWKDDRYHKYNGVSLPHALATKYPQAAYSLEWFWFFPNPDLGRDEEGVLRRYHVYDFSVQKAFVITRRKLGLPEFVTPHAMRHFYATHFLQHLLAEGIPESMARHQLQQHLRHVSPNTMDWYVHLAMPDNPLVKSPLDLLVEKKSNLSNCVG